MGARSALDQLGLVNPLRQIPTLLQDDGSVLTESAAILIHLGLEHPVSGLLPAEPDARGQAIRGPVYIAANCCAAIGVIDHPERCCADIDASARERMLRGARDRLHACWVVEPTLMADDLPVARMSHASSTRSWPFNPNRHFAAPQQRQRSRASPGRGKCQWQPTPCLSGP